MAEQIKASGKNLTTIYTTHAHPDHFFGVAVLKREFPNARYVALPEVAKRIHGAWPDRRNFGCPHTATSCPAEPSLPEPLSDPK